MKVIDLVKKIEDTKLYIEIIEIGSYASFGFYNKDTIKQCKFIKSTIAKINANYYDNKRLLEIYIK